MPADQLAHPSWATALRVRCGAGVLVCPEDWVGPDALVRSDRGNLVVHEVEALMHPLDLDLPRGRFCAVRGETAPVLAMSLARDWAPLMLLVHRDLPAVAVALWRRGYSASAGTLIVDVAGSWGGA